MQYVSTRGQSPAQTFAEILLSGPAPDGGLWLPKVWPHIGADEIAGFRGEHYGEVAHAVLLRFVGGDFASEELREDIDAAYAVFDRAEIAPVRQIGESRYLLELLHGPTLAFKDIAMQLLARLFARVLEREDRRATIVVATSGDTGSAAIAAFAGLPHIELFVLHPHGRISEVQRLQMTTATAQNVHNIALNGSFDEAQSIVKALFADASFARGAALMAVNSINFARIVAQCVYYFTAASQLDGAPVFVVPTGNFGDVFAGACAARMGLPIGKLVIATNTNDILARALHTGAYNREELRQTLSPSMDIQIASNFERALYLASGEDPEWTGIAMRSFGETGALAIPADMLHALRKRYLAASTDDEGTLSEMTRIHRDRGMMIDPHTAVALAVSRSLDASPDAPVVTLATAHPAKFPDAVRRATGVQIEMPPSIAAMFGKPERAENLPPDVSAVKGFIARTLRQRM